MYQHGRLNNAGWVLQSSCPGVAPIWAGGTASQLCGVGVSVIALMATTYTRNRATQNSVSLYGDFFISFGQFLCRRAETWIRNGGNVWLAPRHAYRPRPHPERTPYPAVDPPAQPYMINPDPEPLPWLAIPYMGKPNPWRAPNFRREPGYSAPGQPVPSHDWVPRWEPNPKLAGNPIPVKRVPLVLRPPKTKTEKERKVAATLRGTVVGNVVSGVTESGDAIDAFWRSLPPEINRRQDGFDKFGRPVYKYVRRSFPNKMKDIWEHWEDVSLTELAQQLALEKAEDWMFGRMGSHGAEAVQASGEWTARPVGFSFGPLH